jgi:lipoprotein-anchoring transpeptidase ErfK/SrfK
MEVAKKIGASAPLGMKFKSRQPTGEIVPVNAPGRDPIVTRILWLRGLERRNANAFSRMIYIHGTPEESKLGTPASYGCIRMRSKDIVQLFNMVGSGAKVIVDNEHLPQPMLGPQIQRIAQSGY